MIFGSDSSIKVTDNFTYLGENRLREYKASKRGQKILPSPRRKSKWNKRQQSFRCSSNYLTPRVFCVKEVETSKRGKESIPVHG